MCIVVSKGKSCSGSIVFIVWPYSILETTRLTHDRHGSVAKRHELAQPTWFKQRRHQECVTGCIYLMRHIFRIINISGNTIIVLPVIVAEHIFIPFISGSQHNQLYIFRTDLIHHTLYQVKSLLVGQTGDDTDHELFLVLRQSQLRLQRLFILGFLLAECLCVIILYDPFICLRIKFIVIDTI